MRKKNKTFNIEIVVVSSDRKISSELSIYERPFLIHPITKSKTYNDDISRVSFEHFDDVSQACLSWDSITYFRARYSSKNGLIDFMRWMNEKYTFSS